ncbi:MAG: acetolactate synthase small subunit [Clostridiales Family XIII bacterium]|jgi:acetolactate synthase-1/3 small subunit|nr:acetolactate synthase small subunit [Clostridiales Family XIII bacterium]
MRHTIGVVMENKPGVLSRISALLARRGFNIDSITAGPTRQHDVTRMTVVIEGDEYVADEAAKEMTKLEDVIRIERLSHEESTRREIMLIKVRASKSERTEIVDLAKIMDCSIVDISPTTLMLEHSDTPEKIDLLVSLLSEYDILDMARGGAIALNSGEEEQYIFEIAESRD